MSQPVRSIIAPSKLRQIGSSTELWKFAGSRIPRWNAAIARWASSTWRISVVFRWSVINASNSISRPECPKFAKRVAEVVLREADQLVSGQSWALLPFHDVIANLSLARVKSTLEDEDSATTSRVGKAAL